MKKLLSAVTSAVMSLSLMTGAFTSSVSAAGSFAVAQPNVSMGEIKDVTANKQADSVVFDLGNYKTDAGNDKLYVDVIIDTNGNKMASADAVFTIQSPLKITAIETQSPATGASVMTNIDILGANFICIDSDGEPIVPDKTQASLQLTVSVPSGTADGVYKLGMSKALAFADNSGKKYETTVINGDITVGNVGAQPATTTVKPQETTTVKPQETTTVNSQQNSNADIVFDMGNYKTVAGDDKLFVDVKVDTKGNKMTSADVTFTIQSPLEITEIDATSPATGSTVVTNIDILGANLICTDANSDPMIPDGDSAIFQLTVNVPASTPDGVYKIGMDKCLVYTNGGKKYTTGVINGEIAVGDVSTSVTTTKPVVTTTSSKTPSAVETTTVQTPQSSNAEIVFDMGNYRTVAGDDKLFVDVKVDTKGNKMTSADVTFTIQSPLEITEIDAASPATGSTVVTNIDILGANLICTDENSDPMIPDADSAIFQLTVNVPASTPDGVYKIGMDKCLVYTNGGKKYTTGVINGEISVGDISTPVTTTKPVVTTTSSKTPSAVETTTVQTPQSSNAEIVFDMGNYKTVAGDDKLFVDVKVETKGNKMTSADVIFNIQSPLEITEIDAASPATGSTVVTNIAILGANLICTDENSDPMIPDADSAIFQLTVNVPANTPDGTYKIGMDQCLVYTNGGKKYTTGVINGNIVVGNGGTDTPDTPEKAITFSFGEYTATPGKPLFVDVAVDTNGQPIGGVDAVFKIDSPLTITEIDATSPATGASVSSNVKELGANFTCIGADGEGIVPTSGAVFQLTVDVPSDIKPGTYYIDFGSKLDVVKNSRESYSNVSSNKGVIVVAGAGTDPIVSSTTTTASTPVGTTTTASTPVGSTTTVTPVSGTAEWVIPVVNAAPGEKVSMPVVVKNSAVEVAGAQFNVTAKAPIEYSAVASGDAYGATVVKNDSEKMFAFANTSGAGVKAANDAVIYTLTYTVPADCAEGEYDVTWSNAFISDTNGLDITKNITLTNGKIIVKKGAAPVSGNIKWVLGNETAKPGDTVTLKAVVSDANGDKVPVAGAQFKVNADSPIAYSTIAGGTAYGFPITNNDTETFFAFANVTGAGAAAADGSTIFTLMYKVPEDCADGVYNVKWADGFISDTNGTDITSNIEFVDGTITVKKSEDPTTTGSVEWVIPVEEAEPGDTVTMLVKVKGTSDLPVAGAQFGVNAATPIEYTLASGTPYGATLVVNDDTKEFAFANTSGAGTTAADGATLFTIVYKVPENCADGEYPVVWDAQFVSDTFGKDITKNVTFTDGKIIVKGTTTITSSTTESTTTTTVTTVSTTTDTTTVSTPTETTTVSSSSTTATTTVGPNPGTTTTVNNGNPNTTTTTIVIVPPAEIAWVVDTVYANPGDTVNVNVVVVDPDAKKLGVAGAQFTITNEQPPVLDSVSDAKNGYSSSVVFNKETNEYAFAVENGANVPSVNGTYVATLTYKVPEDCATGTYKVDLGNVLVFAEDGKDITDFVQIVDGAIIVNAVTTTTESTPVDPITTTTTESTPVDPITTTTESTPVDPITTTTESTPVDPVTTTTESTPVDPVTTTTESTPVDPITTTTESTPVDPVTTTTESTPVDPITTTTESTPVDPITTTTVTSPTGSIIWDIDDVTAMPGDTVHVKVIVKDPNGTKLPVAGAEFGIVNGEAIGKPGESGDVNGYGQKIVFNPDTVEAAFANPNGTVSIAEDGSMVIDLVYTIPSDCAEGTYPIDFSGLKVFGEGGTDLTKNVLPMGGSITVGKVTTTSTPGPDVTTTSTPGPDVTTTSTPGPDVTTTSTPGPDVTTTSTPDPDVTTTSTPDPDVTTTSSTEPTTTSSTTTEPEPTTTSSTTTEPEPTTTSSTTTEPIPTGSSTDPITETTTTEPPVSETTSTTSTDPVNPTTTSVYYSIESVPGYYFSHDDGTRANGVKGGFEKGQISSLMKHTVNADGTVTDEEVALDNVNFGSETPASKYDARFGGKTENKDPKLEDYKYDVEVYNGSEALLDADGKPIVVTAYIGVKGDTNLDNIVDGTDASETLTYYAKCSVNNNTPDTVQLSSSAWVTGPTDELDNLSAFLSDVDTNEWSATNWSTPKKVRELDASDASGILTYYAYASATEGAHAGMSSRELWNEIVPNRFG